MENGGEKRGEIGEIEIYNKRERREREEDGGESDASEQMTRRQARVWSNPKIHICMYSRIELCGQ
jgi:hypothetical protein